ncbi:FERM and PDZ domain-containing protein 3-like, partial [Scleropages formosus]
VFSLKVNRATLGQGNRGRNNTLKRSPAMLHSYDGMDSDRVIPGSARQVCIQRHRSHGFGFVAAGERPVVVRSVFADGPSNEKLHPGDQILAINEIPVRDIAREKVIDLVRSCKESIVLTVQQPLQVSHKSAFISAAKKAHLRTNPIKVRFSEQVYSSDPESIFFSAPRAVHPQTMLKDDSLLLIPNILKVFLENGQIKSFTFDSRTTVRDVISSLQDRLSLRYIEHFALVLESGGLEQKHEFYLLQETQPLSHVVERTYFQGMKCLFRICFFPKDPADLLRRDPAAFEYLYIQSRNDVIKERCGADWKLDVVLKLAALHIYITVSSARPNQKISLKHVEKQWGLEPFLPLNLLPSVKEKNVCKSLAQLLKTYQHPPPSGSKVPPLQGKLQYLRVLNDLPPFGCFIFHSVGLDGKQTAMDLLVGPRHGISHVVDLKNNLTTVLVEFRRVAKVQLFHKSQSMARVEPLVLLMEWPDASNFACLIAGYYKLYVDPKKIIYCQSSGHSCMAKPDYRRDHMNPWPVSLSPGSNKKEEAAVREKQLKDWAQCFPHGSPGLCHHFLNEKQQLQEFKHQGQGPADVGENNTDEQQGRPCTKSDPTFKCHEPITMDGRQNLDAEFRDGAKTADPCQQPECFYCDSCKGKMKAAVEVHCSQRSTLRQSSASCESCYASAVDLMSLPLPGRKEGEEEDEDGGKMLMPAPPTIAAPPPGFRDNSSDEDDLKKECKAPDGVVSTEPVPVTLIDAVTTRTVRDRAKELDDALLSTLQALEALSASEDCPHHFQQPSHATGLIVLAAITPESSHDPSHDSNSSELTDVSEMMLAMKQNQNPAYLLAHHINTDCIFSHNDFPLCIPSCNKQNLERGISCEICTAPHPKHLVFSKSVTPRLTSKEESSMLTSPRKGFNRRNSKHGIASHTTVELKVNDPSDWTQHSTDLKGLSSSLSTNIKEKAKDVKGNISSPSTDTTKNCEYEKQRTSVSPSQEITSKASPMHSFVETDNDNIHPTGTTQEAKTTSGSPNNTYGTKGLFSEDVFCTCSFHSNHGFSQTKEMMVFHSSSPTDDERLHAKAKGIQADCSRKYQIQGPGFNITKNSLLPPPKSSPVIPAKATYIGKSEVKSKDFSEPQRCPKSLHSQVEMTKAVNCADTIPASGSRTKFNNKTKSQHSGPLLSFRNFFSATFPARQRHETGQKQDRLQKVREYESEFLEELLKPGTASTESQSQEVSTVPFDTPYLCRAHTNHLKKTPGFSREEKKNCDCKNLGYGYPLPDTQVGFAMECKEQERTVSKTPPLLTKNSCFHGGSSISQAFEIKTTRIRSTSLESSEHHGESLSCMPTCTSHSSCIGNPYYKKLMCSNKVDDNEQMPVYAEVRTVRNKKAEKEKEQVSATRVSAATEPTYAQVGYGKRKGVFSILRKDRVREGLVETGKVMLELHSEEDDDYCSFCFCYRKCEESYKSSEKVELSYSVPLEAMQLDVHALSVVSNALQVLEAEDCCKEDAKKEEKAQSPEIDLRGSTTLEGSLKRVEALQQKTFSLPSAFLDAQLDANELLGILRQFAHNLQAENKPQPQARRLREFKVQLTRCFKEFRVSCQRMAAVEKSPIVMLSAISASFQVLCSLMQTFIWLLQAMHSEGQRLQLLYKVEEVALNYTLLLRAAEESMTHSSCTPENLNCDSPLCISANVDLF